MLLILVHHAEALGPEVDPQRPLSPRGIGQAAEVAASLKYAGFIPEAIWHSGKLRARQTADTCYRVCNPFADFRMVRGIRPDDGPEGIREEIVAETRNVLIVSHMPLLPALLASFVPTATSFPLHGSVVLEPAGDQWSERWRFHPTQ